MDDIFYKTETAQQLGYEVVVIADANGLHFKYKKNIPMIPYELQS